MGIESLLSIIGIILGSIGALLYASQTWKRNNRPRVASWLAWAITNTVFTWLAYRQGAYWAAAFCSSAAILNYTIVAIAFMRGRASYKQEDMISVIAVLVCITFVVMSSNGVVVALVSIAANLIAAIPTYHNAWFHARHETWHLFGVNVIANILGLLSAGGFDDFTKIAGPLVAIFCNSSMAIIILWRQQEARYHTAATTVTLGMMADL